MQIQCPHCQEWTDSDNETCVFCKKPLNDDKPSPLKKVEDENSIVDLSQLYANGEGKKAEYIIKSQPDREVWLKGRPTTGRAILKDRRISLIMTGISVIALIILTILALL